MDDGCSPTVGILSFCRICHIRFCGFGFIAAMQNLNEAAIQNVWRERKTAVRDFCGAIRIRMNDIRMSANWWF